MNRCLTLLLGVHVAWSLPGARQNQTAEHKDTLEDVCQDCILAATKVDSNHSVPSCYNVVLE